LREGDSQDLQPVAWDNAGMETIHLAGDIDPDNTVPDISCSNCQACCCRLEVMLMGEDEHVPADLTSRDSWGGWVMRRLADGWCAALDRQTMRCTIYELRPLICRDYPAGGSDCVEQRAQLTVTAAA
jgi:Fe-S-cluster containining protein